MYFQKRFQIILESQISEIMLPAEGGILFLRTLSLPVLLYLLEIMPLMKDTEVSSSTKVMWKEEKVLLALNLLLS